MNLNNYKYNINNFKNFIPDVNLENNIDVLISKIKDLHLALFSAISSLKYFYTYKVPNLKREIKKVQVSIIEFVESIDNKSTQINQYNAKIKLTNDLKTWVTHSNRIDIINCYLKIGNNMDNENIPILFDVECTSLNVRPISTTQFDYLNGYEAFKESKWNVCSEYGIEYCFQLLEKGWTRLLSLKKRATSAIKNQIESLV